MAGYSRTPLVQKLGIKSGHRVALAYAPAGVVATLNPLPTDAKLHHQLQGKRPFHIILAFVRSEAQLRRHVAAWARRLAPNGGLWLCWPKKASGESTDLSDGVVRRIGLAVGLVDNKVCAVDDVWSGLRFVHRLKDRGVKSSVQPGVGRDAGPFLIFD